ncbi:FAD-dependent oxidoreductase [Desulforhabdus amnigena]|nr:FAD-dependent oxidoreductase [Desulforhabdus amnigena]NLJ28564.1 FAD-dependent oxidoreductase [Deltaproteobacteria bacterium]
MMEKQPSKPNEVDVLATCSAACPVHTDTRGYVQCISQGDYEGALDLLLEVNPFPSVCGRICHHPCESECRRKEIDSPVSLRMLKRFVVENTREYRSKRRKPIERTKGKKVAVVGAGPSGLTAAKDLAVMGYGVTVFEKDNVLGGMLAHAIPRYRLPVDALQEDIDDILATGIEARTNVEVGKDISFEQLRKDYDAILIAVGLSESNSLPISGINAEGVLLGIPFLWDVANQQPPKLGDRVLIIGGGNVAIDVARAAKRLGPSKVYMACLESRAEMPAWKWEIEEAEEEGIEIFNSWGPKAILEKDGKVTGIQFKKCTRVFDENRRFSPQFDEETVKTVEVDNVIVTIGQRSNLDCLTGSPVAVDRGRLVCDRASLTTSERGVFSCGEVMTGPGSAIAAIGTGHEAARVIDRYLETGEILKLPQKAIQTIGDLPKKTAARAKQFSRLEVPLTDPAQRIRDFSPIEPGYTEAEALKEAHRCLACATGAVLEDPAVCAGCLTCVRICPFGVATVDRTAVMPAQECQTCGLCAAECPAAGVALARFATNKMKEQLGVILNQADQSRISRPFIVSYCCLNEATSRKYLVQQEHVEIEETGILRVMVPCVGRLSALDLVSPFELGADRVVVIACKEDGCFYTGAEELLQRRIKNVRKFLDEIKVGAENLLYYQTKTNAEESWPEFWQEAKKIVGKAVVA